jgi:hypothetical protein
VGVSEALALEEMEGDTVVHPEGLREGEPVVEPLVEPETLGLLLALAESVGCAGPRRAARRRSAMTRHIPSKLLNR